MRVRQIKALDTRLEHCDDLVSEIMGHLHRVNSTIGSINNLLATAKKIVSYEKRGKIALKKDALEKEFFNGNTIELDKEETDLLSKVGVRADDPIDLESIWKEYENEEMKKIKEDKEKEVRSRVKKIFNKGVVSFDRYKQNSSSHR
jgi:hypothetical protein